MTSYALENAYGLQAERKEITIDLYDSFINYLDSTSDKTKETYMTSLRQFFKWLSENNITAPSRFDVIRFRDETIERCKSSTSRAYMVAVKMFFDWLENNHIYPNIAKNIKSAKIDNSPKKDYLTSEQCKRLLNSIDRTSLKGLRDYAIISLMITGGLRDIEIERANIEDIRTLGNMRVLYIQGKGHSAKDDYIKLYESVDVAIGEYLKARGDYKGNSPLFISVSNHNGNERINVRSISRLVKTAMRNIGINSDRITAHSLRRTAINLSLMQNNRDVLETQQFARHQNINTTMIYVNCLKKEDNKCSDLVGDLLFK